MLTHGAEITHARIQLGGALGSWGAALLEPYSDKPDIKGLMRNSRESLESLVGQFWEDGWSTVCSTEICRASAVQNIRSIPSFLEHTLHR